MSIRNIFEIIGALITILDTHFIFLVSPLEKEFFLLWSSGENICLLKNTHRQ